LPKQLIPVSIVVFAASTVQAGNKCSAQSCTYCVAGIKFAALQTKNMKELIEKLVNEAGLSEKQAWQAITIVKDFAKSKFPMFGSAIEKAFAKHAKKEDEDFLD